jgi:glycosyltransferase involved in cell wall biosynthesis
MGMGVPVVCNDIGDTGNIIAATGTGFVINEFDDDHMMKAAAAVAGLEGIEKSYIRTCAREIFDLKSGVQKYNDIYSRIFKDHNVGVA